MADLPLHEASIGLLRHWGDATFAPPSVYFLNFGHANQLFSFLVLLVSFAVPMAWACKIVVAASLVALAVAAAHFADHVRASRWTALLVAPVGLGWLFFWGLVQNIIGLVALMALLPAIDRFARRPTGRGALHMCAAMVLLHFAHQAMQVVACAAIVLFSLGPAIKPKSWALRASPIAFCALLVYLANVYAWRSAGPRHRAMAPFEWKDTSYKLASIPGVLFAGYEPYVRNLVMLIAVIPVVLFVVDRVRHRQRVHRAFWQRMHDLRFDLLALVLFGVFLAAPFTIKSTTLVYHRFLPPAWAVIAVCGAAGTSAFARPLARALCAALPIASVLVAWPTFVDSDRIYSDLDTLMPSIEKGSSVVSLDIGPNHPHRLWGPMVTMGRVVAVKGGRSLFDYTQSPVSPVAQRPEKQWAEPMDRMDKNVFGFRPAWDFTRFRYLILATPMPTRAAAVTLAVRNEAVLIGAKGDLYLFESRLPLVPIDADDAPLPIPHPASLRKRLEEVSHELEQIDQAGSVAETAPPAAAALLPNGPAPESP
jgi:hypothetical protein